MLRRVAGLQLYSDTKVDEQLLGFPWRKRENAFQDCLSTPVFSMGCTRHQSLLTDSRQRLVDKQRDRETDKTDIQRDRQTDTEKKTERQADRERQR